MPAPLRLALLPRMVHPSIPGVPYFFLKKDIIEGMPLVFVFASRFCCVDLLSLAATFCFCKASNSMISTIL
jgi:hypothetical protein